MTPRRALAPSVMLALIITCSCGGTSDPELPDTGLDVPDVLPDGTDVPSDVGEEGDGDGGCPAGETPCPGGCTDTDADPLNCGSCGNECATGEVCSGGTCVTECADPLVDCEGACVDLTSDPMNCGSCGNECPEGGVDDVNTVPGCVDSECVLLCADGWFDLDGEPGCEYACTWTSDVEICNGVDDDCNGAADETFDCVFGEAVVCTADCGSTGTGTCGFTCEVPAGADCVPPVETCNGLDDDCDTVADEDWDCAAGETVSCTTDCGGVGSGTCTDACEIPTGADCAEGPELCNGLDDNCNGSADETFDCVMDEPTACTTTCGSVGTGTCSSTCDLPTGADCTPPAEECNGLDDDCDTLADEDWDCVMGETVSCTTDCSTPGTGLCTATCEIPTGTGCAAGTETCNGVDDDCNGLADDTFDCVRFELVSCVTSCGSTGNGNCSATCELPTGTDCVAPPETCNGIDDDCDGLEDETYPCVQGETLTCTTLCGTTGTGVCSMSCSLPSAASCTPPSEVCNGLDEDCDGSPDDTFPCIQGMAGIPCTTTCGSSGTGTCSTTCTLPAPADCTPPAEICNGIDDDCDTVEDETFPCVWGQPTSCTTTCGSTGTGTCSSTCALPPAWDCTPPAETCNGADDDCSGTADDGAGMECVQGTSGNPCTTTCGSTGTGTCSATCTLDTCTPPAETCNGADDDCDTVEDNGFACVQGATGLACTTTGGLSGTQDCTASCTLGECCAAEVCNGIDDDCDGSPDDGFACIQGATGLSCTTGGGASGTQDCTASCTLGACCAATEVCGNGWDDDCDTIPDASEPECSTPEPCETCPCSNTAITGTGTYEENTCSFSDNYSSYYYCSWTYSGGDAVYRFIPPTSRTYTIDTDGSDTGFDTMLSVWNSSCSELDCDDDGHGSYLWSSLSIYLTAGTTYYIIVDGYSGDCGNFDLNIS